MKKYFLTLDIHSQQFGGSFGNRFYYRIYRKSLLFFEKNLAVFSKDSIESSELLSGLVSEPLPIEFPDDNSAILWFKLKYGS